MNPVRQPSSPPRDDRHGPEGPSKKKRRRRVTAYTCEQCTKRKQKCNKEIPCNNCIARGIADQCILYMPRHSPSPSINTSPVPIAMQSLVDGDDVCMPALSSSVTALSAAKSPAQLSNPSNEDFKEEMRQRMKRIEDLLIGAQVDRFSEASDSLSLLSRISAIHHDEGPLLEATPPLPQLPSRLRHVCVTSGIQPEMISQLVDELPAKSFATALADRYFKFINLLRYPILESHFRSAMDRLYEKQAESSLDSESLRSLPLVFIVLATSVMNASEEFAGDEASRRATSLRLYWCSRRSSLVAASIQPESTELAVTGLLSSMYLLLVHDRRLTECWALLGASVRNALAVGFHRDGSMTGLDTLETEYRRRIWSYFYHADRHSSLILGRPSAINETYYDTHEPSNVDLELIQRGQAIVSKPLTEPTSATFLILRRRFAQIIGKIAHHFQKLHELATYKEVEVLDEEILNFVDSLPPHFRLEEPDVSLDHLRLYLSLQRYALGTEICLTRILLHRPWLLRKFWNDKYSLSRQACFESAKLDFRLRQAFRKRDPQKHDQFFTGQFREFNAAMVAGIAAIVQPRAPDAEEMQLILTTFLDRHPIDKQVGKPQTSQKEVAIIYALYRRSVQMIEQGEPPIDQQQPQDPIPLFLGTNSKAQQELPGLDDGDQSHHSYPAFGEERSTAILVRDIYSTMMKMGIVAKPVSSPATRPERMSPSKTTSSPNQDAHILGTFDPQTFFNEWLSGNNNVHAYSPPEATDDVVVPPLDETLFGGPHTLWAPNGFDMSQFGEEPQMYLNPLPHWSQL